MGNRADLHMMLKNAIGSNNVYFQPPESIKLEYPCIVYELDNINTKYANDNPYTRMNQYSATLIDYDADSELVTDILNLHTVCWAKFNRCFVSDGLYHYTFTLNY